MAALLWLVLLAPLLLAAVGFAFRKQYWTLALPVLAAAVVLTVGVVLILANGTGPVVAADGWLRVDALSAWMLAVVGAVAVIALWGGAPMRNHSYASIGSFSALLSLFLAAMSLALVADNVGLMWVAIELTTITTAFLVASGEGRNSLEAAWKYVVLGAVGVAIAFLGVALLAAASMTLAEPSVSWTMLMAHAGSLEPNLAKLAGALAVLGFATKAGLAPMHSWLPDAHSQAPAPVSGLMSGVLLSVAFYAILRVQAITDAVVGPELMQTMLLTAGLLSLAVTAGLVITQRDFKRLLAYSSIEHMGLLALGAAAGGPLAIAAVLLHILGHGLIKSTMFVLAGRISEATGSHDIADVRGLLGTRPDLGGPFLIGTAGLLGFPPFVTFFTEVAIIVAGFQRGLAWQMGLACVLLLVVFAGITRQVLAMTLGDGQPAGGRPVWWRRLPIGLALFASAVLGFAAWPLAGTLAQAVAALGGVR
jgi:hydrogenase-4 component F